MNTKKLLLAYCSVGLILIGTVTFLLVVSLSSREAQTVSVELTRQDWAAVDAATTDAMHMMIRGGAPVDNDLLVRLERATQRIRDAVTR